MTRTLGVIAVVAVSIAGTVVAGQAPDPKTVSTGKKLYVT